MGIRTLLLPILLFGTSICRATDELIKFSDLRQEKVSSATTFPKKHTTVVVYIGGRNDLASFIKRNIEQLKMIGSNENITFLLYLNIMHYGRTLLTQRFIVFKDRIVQVGEDDSLDSGHPSTLIKACTWAFTNFPSDVRVLILWNHGTGDLEPEYRRVINPSELYHYNPVTRMVDIDRSVGFLEYLEKANAFPNRGICFDNATRHYLSNRDVGQALTTVSQNCLGGQPIDVLACDACLMASVGFTRSLKLPNQQPVARYLVASQEVVLASGYPYTALFSITAHRPQSAEELARHIVDAFARSYQTITHEYTQSAIDLTKMEPVYQAIDAVAALLIDGMNNEVNRSVHNLIARASALNMCTSFAEPSYKDMHHLFQNMLRDLHTVQLQTPQKTAAFREALATALREACAALKQAVIANNAGKKLLHATGLSIYVPLHNIHHSFSGTDFGQTSLWTKMLQQYVRP